MRRLDDGRLVLSATDLSDFLACGHLTEIVQRRTNGEDIARDTSAMTVMLSNLGARHEENYLAQLDGDGRKVKKFAADAAGAAATVADLECAAGQTLEAMHDGYDVIYQPVLFRDDWFGRADFLFRVETPSKLWDHSYEVGDAKLARRVRAEALLQLCEYSTQVAAIQGVMPARMRVILGNLEEHSYHVHEFLAYHHEVKQMLIEAVRDGDRNTYPLPVRHCQVCEFATRCDARRRSDDHLSLVARMRGDAVRKLENAGITTVAALGAASGLDRVPGMQRATFESLREQARMQTSGSLPDGTPQYELLEPVVPREGLCALPPPSPGDMFFDMEGDGLARDEQLEYLFGVVESVDGAWSYWSRFGHSSRDERLAFEAFVDHAIARLDADPGMHIYHYASYERSALQRLMGRHATREEEVDRLLRGGVLVDLYRVVCQSLRLSTEHYGLKDVERLYMSGRSGAVADAQDSILVYERWLESGAIEAERDPGLLEDIARYNEEDCRSTLLLRDWLEQRRADVEQPDSIALPRPERVEGRPPESQQEEIDAVQRLRLDLTAGVPDDLAERTAEQQATWLLAQLIDYHRREAKSGWWRYFRLLELTDAELADDTDALGPLEFLRHVDDAAPLNIDEYRFEPQEHRIRVGDKPVDPKADGHRGLGAGEVVSLDSRLCLVQLKRGQAHVTRGHARYLIASRPYDTVEQRRSLRALAAWVLANRIDAPGTLRAARDLLLRRPPRLRGQAGDASLRMPGESAQDAATRIASSLDAGCLAIQGPPGSGKTYTAARIALRLVTQGKRVAITATAHKAISRLLEEICDGAHGVHDAIRVVQRADPEDACESDEVRIIKADAAAGALHAGEVDVMGGTAWLFAREDMAGRFDTIIVDEAGQMSLADVLAVSRAATNIVLVGDPRQLSHVVQGSHPHGAERSALEHLIGDEITIAPERGVLLDRTRRMHPEVCRFVSDAFYQSLLHAEPACAVQRIGSAADPLTGLRLRLVHHDGDRTSSEAEAEVVAEVVDALLGMPWRDRDGDERPLRLQDIVVVAPYNAHVACLGAHLPEGARIGTVDKFQGQEAAVSIFSMATSSAGDLPRNLEFLYSLNRLNVAVSRAQCLSVLVCSPGLLRARCQTPEQMRLVNALCRYAQAAMPWSRAPSADPRVHAPREVQPGRPKR